MDSVQTFGLRVWSAAGGAAMVKVAKKRWAKVRKEAKNVKRSNSDATILRGGTTCRQDFDSRDHYALAALGDGRRLIYEIAEVVAMDFCRTCQREISCCACYGAAGCVREIILSLVRKIRFFNICRYSRSHVLERHEKTISQLPAREILTVSIVSVAARGGPSSLSSADRNGEIRRRGSECRPSARRLVRRRPSPE